jgi:hypothetical protein
MVLDAGFRIGFDRSAVASRRTPKVAESANEEMRALKKGSARC